MADINAPSVIQITDANGNPVPGAKAYFYDTGTSTPRTVYSDTAGTTPHASPVVADSGGFLPPIYVTATVKMDVKTAADAAVPGYPVDPAARVNVVGSAASAISYNPHAETPETNVQDALDSISDSLGSISDRFTGGGTRQIFGWNGTDVVWQDRITLGTEVGASTTTVDFTGIPAGVRRVTIMFDDVSLSGTDGILVQLGDSGGVEATGYTSSSAHVDNAVVPAVANFTSGFFMAGGVASYARSGRMVLSRMNNSHKWVSAGSVLLSTAAMAIFAGKKTLSAELDRVRITVTGANTFDAGNINIGYE